MQSSETGVTALLSGMAEGDASAAEKLIPIVYEELKRLARRYMRREKANHTLELVRLLAAGGAFGEVGRHKVGLGRFEAVDSPHGQLSPPGRTASRHHCSHPDLSSVERTERSAW